jgi:hypothetical protein
LSPFAPLKLRYFRGAKGDSRVIRLESPIGARHGPE